MDRKRQEIDTLSIQTLNQNMGQDNDSLAENVHNMTSGILGQWIGKEKKCIHFSTETHTQNMHGTCQQLTN